MSERVDRPGPGHLDDAVRVRPLGGVEVHLGVGPRRDVGEDEVPGAGARRALPGFAAVEVDAVQAVVARLLERRLGQQQVGVGGQVVEGVAWAGVAAVVLERVALVGELLATARTRRRPEGALGHAGPRFGLAE